MKEIKNLDDTKPETFLKFYNAAKEMQQVLIENQIQSKQEYESSRADFFKMQAAVEKNKKRMARKEKRE